METNRHRNPDGSISTKCSRCLSWSRGTACCNPACFRTAATIAANTRKCVCGETAVRVLLWPLAGSEWLHEETGTAACKEI
jgi:hypothetical protein